MRRARADWAFTIAVLVAIAAVPWGPSLVGANRSHTSLWPRCLEPRLAAGDVYPVDRGLALAVTRGIASDHPAVAPLVDAVTDYEAAHPIASEDTFGGGRLGTGDPLRYTLTVIALAERPDLARPELITDLVEAAAGRDSSLRYAGMAGVNEFMATSAYPPDGHGGQNWDLYGPIEGQSRYAFRSIVGSDDWRHGEGSARGVFGCDDERKEK